MHNIPRIESTDRSKKSPVQMCYFLRIICEADKLDKTEVMIIEMTKIPILFILYLKQKDYKDMVRNKQKTLNSLNTLLFFKMSWTDKRLFLFSHSFE